RASTSTRSTAWRSCGCRSPPVPTRSPRRSGGSRRSRAERSRPRRAGGTGTRGGSGGGQDAAVGARVGQALVAVVPAHQVRRLAVAATHLEDLALAARLGDLATLDDDPVAHLRAHAITSFAVLTSPGGQHYRPS